VKPYRKNLVFDVDKVFLDILSKEQYERLLTKDYRSTLQRGLGTLDAASSNLRTINYRGMELVVAIRPGTFDFLKSLSGKFNLYVVTQIGALDKDLIY
jgi:hypothetical protein